MSGFAAFLIAVGVVSSIFFVLMLRTDRIRERRRAYADSSTGDSTVSSGNDGFGLLNWFGGTSSTSSSDDSCSSSSSFSGGGDTGCSNDGGGGGGD